MTLTDDLTAKLKASEEAWHEHLRALVTDPQAARVNDHGTAAEKRRLRFHDGYVRGYRDGFTAAGETPTAGLSSLTMRWDATHWFPFVEDENANITGPGHQDKAAFAASVNQYDTVTNGEAMPQREQWTADDVSHTWVIRDPENSERLLGADAEQPGALPVTCLWGKR